MITNPAARIDMRVSHPESRPVPNYALRRTLAAFALVGAGFTTWAGGNLLWSNWRRVDPGIDLSKLPTATVTVGPGQQPPGVVAEVDPKAYEHREQEYDLEKIVLAQAHTRDLAGDPELAEGQLVKVPAVPGDK